MIIRITLVLLLFHLDELLIAGILTNLADFIHEVTINASMHIFVISIKIKIVHFCL